MSPIRTTDGPLPGSFPRVSGDEPSLRVLDPTQCLFSPRERG